MHTTYITTKDIATAFINSKHGWAVAEQFQDIYDDMSEENLSMQNSNALRYIKEALSSLVGSGVFSERSKEELMGVLEDLVQHLQWNS